MNKGETHTNAKLTEADVKAIRALRAEGMKLRTIAERFPVSYVAIYNVVSGRSWRHV